MADIPGRAALNRLLEHRSLHCLSIYWPRQEVGEQLTRIPSFPASPFQLLETLLVARDMPSDVREALLNELNSKRDDLSFHAKDSRGGVVFVAPGFFQGYSLPGMVPMITALGDRFCLKPLLPWMDEGKVFFVLALTHRDARLFRGTAEDIDELSLWSTPRFAQGNQYDARANHGSWKFSASNTREIANYFRQVDFAVQRALADQRGPLVLACLGYLATIYEQVNSYSHLTKVKVPGDPELWTLDELRERAWQMLQPYLRRKRESAVWAFRQPLEGRRTATNLNEIVSAAEAGSIETLVLDDEVWQLRRFNGDSDIISLDEQELVDEGMLDFAVVKTLLHGGNVISFPRSRLPYPHRLVAAILRCHNSEVRADSP